MVLEYFLYIFKGIGMTTTICNSKDIKYIWSTSDDDGLTSMTFLSEDNIIYATTCAYDDNNSDMEYKYYKSIDTDNNEALWNQLMLDNLENFDKCFKEVTDEEDIEYIKNKKRVYTIFTRDTEHNLSHDLLRSMIIALYTNLTNEISISDDMLNTLYVDAVTLLSGVGPGQQREDVLDTIREYTNESLESLFDSPVLLYKEHQYVSLVLDIINLIRKIPTRYFCSNIDKGSKLWEIIK